MRFAPILAAVALTWGSSAVEAQHYPRVVVLEGQSTPDMVSTYQDIFLANVNSAGIVAFTARDASIDDDLIVVGGQVLQREGDPVPGSGGTLDSLVGLETSWQINAVGNVVYESNSLDGVASSVDNVLHVDAAKRLQEGDPVVGVPGRFYSGFGWPSITDGGDVFLEIEMTGATADDVAIYVSYSGGAGGIVPMNASSLFREGAAITGGALQGSSWSSAPFDRCVANGSGVLLVDGLLQVGGATTAANDDVLVRKRPGLDYELLARAGDLLVTPVSGSGVPIVLFSRMALASNDDWAALVSLPPAQTTTAADEAVLGSIGGAPPIVLVQKSQSISSVTGIPGTSLGDIESVAINGSGMVLILAGVASNIPSQLPYDEALFLWEAGTLTVVSSDDIPVPEFPGQSIGDIGSGEIAINDQGRIFFGASLLPYSGFDGVFEVVEISVPPVDSIACAQSGVQIAATWSLPAGSVYDGIRIFLDGQLIQVIAGSATSFTSPMLTANGYHLLAAVPFVGIDEAPPASCFVSVALPPDYVVCSNPQPPTPILSFGNAIEDVLSVSPNVLIEDIAIALQITHGQQGDLDIFVVSPLGTQVYLATDIGGSLDDVDITFADFGSPLAYWTDLAGGGHVRPEGPGTMADFDCEFSGGDWILSVYDGAAGNTGTLDSWCLEIYENETPGPDCCPPRTDLTCTNVGACGGPAVVLSWNANYGYAAVELLRVTGSNPVTIPLAPTATSYLDTGVAIGASHTYTLRYQCAPGGQIQDSGSCSVSVNVTSVPDVFDLSCVADPCGAGAVSLSWISPVNYDSLELRRAGVFLADVTGSTDYVDTAPLTGLAQYSLVGQCLGVTGTSFCTVDTTLPEIIDFDCDPDFCVGQVELSWDIGAAPYGQLTLERDGSFLADVTGLSMFIDLGVTWSGGSATYTLTGSCGAFSTPSESCVVDLDFPLPSSFACTSDLGVDDITVVWFSPVTYTSIQIYRDGLLVATPAPADSSFIDTDLPGGIYTYTLVFACPGGSGSRQCSDLLIPGDEFLLIARDVSGSAPPTVRDGISVHDPVTGQVIGNHFQEFLNDQIFLATNAIVGPLEAGGEPAIYLSDSLGTDSNNGSVVRFGLTGQFLYQYIDESLYDDVRGMEFQGDTLYLTSVNDDVVAAYDIGSETGSTFIFVDAPSDLLFLTSGDLLVGSIGTDTVTLYDSTGNDPVVVASVVSPSQIAALSNGNFIVGSENGSASTIVEFSLTGGIVASYATGIDVKGIHELPSGLVLFTTGTAAGIYTLDRTTGTVTNLHSALGESYLYIERVQITPIAPSILFVRGDCNDDGASNIADAVFLLGNLFPGSGTPNTLACLDAGDANDDESIDIGDAIAILGALFGAPAVPLPAPGGTEGCGPDPSGTVLLNCAQYDSCP